MDIFEIIKIFLVSLIEGITEWLPISSTGHMKLFDEFVKLNFSNDFRELFFVVIQLGAIAAVACIYFSKLNPFSSSKDKEEKRQTWRLWSKVVVGCVPIIIAGLFFDDIVASFLGDKKTEGVIIAIALIFYGILFILIEDNKSRFSNYGKIKKVEDISFRDALKVGAFQVLSIIPGTSRSGSTIIGGLISGLSREAVTEFTFFMGIPVMFGASLLKIVKYDSIISIVELQYLAISLLVTFIVSIFAIKFIMKYIKKNDFKVFGWYRIILGVVVLVYFILK